MSRLELASIVVMRLFWGIRVLGGVAAIALYFVDMPIGATLVWLSGCGFGLLAGLLLCGWVAGEKVTA